MSAEQTDIENSLIPFSKQQAKIMLEAGYLWMDMGQHDKAREIFAGVAALMPKSEVPQLALGTLEFVQGRHDKALQSYRAAQRLAPTSGLIRAYCGEALLFMGKANEAQKEFKAAVDLDPEGDGSRFAQALMSANEAGVFASMGSK